EQLAFRDIAGDAGETDDVALGVPHLKAAVMHPADFAVRSNDAILNVDRWLAGPELFESRERVLPHFRQDRVRPLVWVGVQIRDRTPPNRFITRAHVVNRFEPGRRYPEDVGEIVRQL